VQERIAIAPDASEEAVRAAIVERARRRGFRRFVLRRGEDAVAPPDAEVWLRDGARLLPREGGAAIDVRAVGDLAALEGALDETPSGGVLLLEWTGDRVIPLESAVARRGRRFQVWTFARTPDEVPAALGALEHGADRVIVAVRSVADVDHLETAIGTGVPSGLEWALVTVAEVHPAGVGDRVIVDTTSLLAPDEGLLVGSAAAFLFHVASEAVGSAFSRPRPFRVNAGAAHSYVLAPDGTTRYLSELAGGDVVVAVRPHGSARVVRVGRIKVERRPMALVRAEVDGVSRTVFVQEAETVRLSGERERVPITSLTAGAKVQGVRLPPARHLGTVVEETIEER
jgi:3-dehydroquinate synthase II